MCAISIDRAAGTRRSGKPYKKYENKKLLFKCFSQIKIQKIQKPGSKMYVFSQIQYRQKWIVNDLEHWKEFAIRTQVKPIHQKHWSGISQNNLDKTALVDFFLLSSSKKSNNVISFRSNQTYLKTIKSFKVRETQKITRNKKKSVKKRITSSQKRRKWANWMASNWDLITYTLYVYTWTI